MSIRIEDLARPVEPIDPETPLDDAAHRLSTRPELPGLPVVFDGLVVGIVSREALLDLLARGNDSAGLRSANVTRVMHRDPFLVGMDERAVVVARRASQVAPDRLRAGIVAARGQACCGVLESGDLIRALSSENTAVTRTRALDRSQAGDLQERIRRMETERRDWLDMLGHELRTPLNALLGHAERLQTGEASEAEARSSAKAILGGCVALDSILTRLIGAGPGRGRRCAPGHGETLRLKTLAMDIQSLWAARAEEAGVRLKVTATGARHTDFTIDAAGLRQVVNNLVSNALKYAGGTAVCIHLELAGGASGRDLRVAVSDGGPGIADADKPRIFERQYRNRSACDTAGGQGLGLYLARETARALGGELTVGDGEGGGSVFRLRVPVRQADDTDRPRAMPALRRESLELGELLLVEDHAPSLALARSTLEAAGWQVDIAFNIAQAVRRAAHKPYQAIICDIHLPDGEGEELIAALREARGPNGHTPVMALSADTSEQRAEACRRAGFRLLAHKPLQGRQLVALLIDMILAGGQEPPAQRAG